MCSVRWGDFYGAAKHLEETVIRGQEGQPYFLYYDYQLNPSKTSEYQADPEWIALQEMAGQHPEGFGRWVVTDDAGNVVDELGPE